MDSHWSECSSSTSAESLDRSPEAHNPPAEEATSTQLALTLRHPPCRVCGGKGTGLHYGAFTCDACKSFFGRRLPRGSSLQCLRSGNCRIIVGRGQCPACRFRKCLSVGMSKEGVKIGRSSYMQVTAAIEEVKRLELQLKLRQDGALVSQEEHIIRMDQIVHRLTNAHLMLTPHSKQFYEHIYEFERMYLETKAMEAMLYGRRAMLQRQEYNEIYSRTSIDVDGRKAILRDLLPVFEKSLQRYMTFVRYVPGYNQLGVEDQIRILRSGHMESMSLLHLDVFNADEGLFVLPHHPFMVYNLSEMLGYGVIDVNVYKTTLHLLLRAQRLDLTDEEKVMACALAFLISDAGLSERGQNIVSANAELVTEALVRLIQRNHDRKEHTFAKLIAIITEMRVINVMYLRQSRNVIIDNCEMNLPATLVRLFGQ